MTKAVGHVVQVLTRDDPQNAGLVVNDLYAAASDVFPTGMASGGAIHNIGGKPGQVGTYPCPPFLTRVSIGGKVGFKLTDPQNVPAVKPAA
jgi:hypothetical protein